MLWLLIGVLSLLALTLMVLPIRSFAPDIADTEDNVAAVLLDQLEEVQRDLDRGIISQTEADAATQEIKRRILIQSRKVGSRDFAAGTSGRGALVVGAFFVPFFAVAYYMFMGSPQIDSLAFADRKEERQEAAQIADLSAQLYDRLANEPDGGPSEGWMLLGQTYLRMGQFQDAADAFKVVSERPEADSGVFSMLSEALIYAENGVVTPPAEAAVDRAIELDPKNPAAVFYKAVVLSQRGEPQDGYDLLLSRLNSADGFYPWMESLLAEANRIGAGIGKPPLQLADFAPMMNAPGPSAEDVANAQEMTEEDRAAFILSMVTRLADRLEDEPADLDGWMRLGNAYSVLGEKAEAISAYERAEALAENIVDNDPRKRSIANALSQLGR